MIGQVPEVFYFDLNSKNRNFIQKYGKISGRGVPDPMDPLGYVPDN